ncbi:tRNA epoxyqueuosine(34) reductase QueG [Clostridium akagii]|uniref:tRNA epoxyqueuosine(34) reductase QueG n=1 Tax=Clostridium akagii TaxID=91623 RepID=UPI0004791757|nr:tRNA epoxyqueuosine(34) reductase QueG [Clostridium akagii]
MSKKSEIIDFCNELGLSEVGFCKCQIFDESQTFFKKRKELNLENEFEEENIYKRINPKLYMEEGKTIMSIAFPYLFNKKVKEELYFSLYTRGRDYHKVVSEYLSKVCNFIEEGLGGKAIYFVDSNALPERYIALKSGVGFVGKNNMIINKRYGSYTFLGEIIMDLDIKPDELVTGKCGKCEKCLNACPTKSISEKKCDPNVCLSYITQKKHIDEEYFHKFKGRLFGCDTCQDVCPFNRIIDYSNLEELRPFEFMDKININELANIDNLIFKAKYALTSSGWRGKNIIQRNAIINLLTNKEIISMDNFRTNSTYVEEYYHRLLKYNKL